MIVELHHKDLVNPAEVNLKGWSVAKYETKKVATTVELPNEKDINKVLNDLYFYSQNIESAWTDNEVWAETPSKHTRSSMVDDLFVIINDVGKVTYSVDVFGFSEK